MNLEKNPLHLGLGATAVVQPEFTGDMEWYSAYGERAAADGDEGRIVSMHTFGASWSQWEVHPRGAEVVLCTSGCITLIQEIEGNEVKTTLAPGQFAVNEKGVWHTADVDPGCTATAVFITAGAGTEHRPR